MEQRPDWHSKATEPILQALVSAQWPLPAKTIDVIANNYLGISDPPSRSTIYTALDMLVAYGWIEELTFQRASKHYRIKEKGREWIESRGVE